MKTHIKESTFKGLIDNLKLQTGNDLDAVGFSSRFGPFEMSFYAEIEDGYMLRVDDFGMNLEGGGWLVMEPTQEQIESMHKEILSKVEEIERSKVVEYQENYGLYGKYY